MKKITESSFLNWFKKNLSNFFMEKVVKKVEDNSITPKGFKTTVPRKEVETKIMPFNYQNFGLIDPMIKKVELYQTFFGKVVQELIHKYPDSTHIFQEYAREIDIYKKSFDNRMMPKNTRISCNDHYDQKEYNIDAPTRKSLFRTAFGSEIIKTLEYFSEKGFKNYPDIDKIRVRFHNSITKFQKREDVVDDVFIDVSSKIKDLQIIRDLWSKPGSQEMEKLDVVKYLYESIGERLPACFYWGLVELMLPGTLKDEEYGYEKSHQTNILFERKKFAYVALSMLSTDSSVIPILNQVINNYAYEKKYSWTFLLGYEHEETSGTLHIHMQEPTNPIISKNAESILPKMFRKGIFALTTYSADHMLNH